MPDSISPSRMDVWLQCPFKYRAEHIQKLPSGTNAAAVAGTCMHAALEELMKLPGPERTVEALKPLIEQALLDIREDPDYQSLTPEQLKDFDAKCRRVTPRAFEFTNLDLQTLNVESTEMKFEVDLDGWILRGVIDLLEDRPDFGRIVWDYKSGKKPWKPYEEAKLLGLEFYAVAINILFGSPPAGVGLLYLNDRYTIKRVPTPQTVARTERRILAVRDGLEKACDTGHFPCKTSKLCDWCAVKPFCPAHGGDPDDIPVHVSVRS
jgi:putative RecB family exonuclease